MTYPSIDLSSKGDNFEKMMTAILAKPMDEKHKVADIVADLKNTLGEGKPGDPKDVQINGVCSFQVLDEFFEDALGKKHHAQYKLSLLRNI